MPDKLQLGRAGGTGFCRIGQGRPLVLIHGLGMHTGFWGPQIAAFAAQRQVIAYDTLGHGSSVLPPENPGLADYTVQLLALLEALDLQRVSLIGHSMGALIALDFALAYPGRVEAVVAMNAVYCRNTAQLQAVAARAALLEAEAYDLSWRQAALDRWFGAPVPAAHLEKAAWVGAALANVQPVGYARAYRLFSNADAAHAGRLADLAMPALFLTGEDDENSSPEMSRRMAAEAPQGEAIILPGQRHMMSLAAPDAVNQSLIRFLN